MAPVATPVPTQNRALLAYTPSHLSEKMLIEGEDAMRKALAFQSTDTRGVWYIGIHDGARPGQQQCTIACFYVVSARLLAKPEGSRDG